MLELAKRYATPVPRYTSYPTAPHFTSLIGTAQHKAWLAALPEQASLSLYFHIAFCDSLCWYCGCNTNIANKYSTVEHYLMSLCGELSNVAHYLPRKHRVTHIHWGGGTPNILRAVDIKRLAERTREQFRLADDVEFAVEIDPRMLDRERVEAFRDAGVTRASIGIQDFDESVQKAINRHQSYETTREAVAMLRAAGIVSINADLVYGLPNQTRASIDRTLDQVLTLDPDRIATFGYAHLPERIRHQSLIDQTTLAGPLERLGQASRLARRLEARGYVRIGIDHFAKPADALASGKVRRNFQGYTTDRPDALIGLGASAISSFPQGYTQNAVKVASYERLVRDTEFATVRGLEFSEDDRLRGYVIERLMCDLVFSADELRERFGDAAAPVIEEAKSLLETDRDGLLEPGADGFRVTERGRSFLRTICACFDAYIGSAEVRHASGV